jgi:hypothetical protein
MAPYNHPELDKKIIWRPAISKELKEMKAKGVSKIHQTKLYKKLDFQQNETSFSIAACCLWKDSNSLNAFSGTLSTCYQ